MSDIRKLLDTITEMAVTSGSVATVAKPMGEVVRRQKDSIFYEDGACESCGCEPCKCDDSNTVDGTKTPSAPKASEFGKWENSALAGKKKKTVKESEDYHTKSAVSALREMWASEDQKRVDELECGQGQRQLNLAEIKSPDRNDPYEQGWSAGHNPNSDDSYNPYERGTPEHKAWENGFAEAEAQSGHYDESAVNDEFKNLDAMEKHTQQGMEKYIGKQVHAAKNTMDEEDVIEGEDLAWDDPDLAQARKFMAAKAKKKPVVIKPKAEVGFRIADVGPGGKESNVRTDAAWDKKHGKKTKIDELSRDTLSSYQEKASDSRRNKHLPTSKVDKRMSGISKASARLEKKNAEK